MVEEKIDELYLEIKGELEKLIESATKRAPESPLWWTSKSTYKLTEELTKIVFVISSGTVQDSFSNI